MLDHLVSFRRLVVFLIHFALVVAASYFAMWLRFDGNIPPGAEAVWLQVLPLLLCVRLATFFPFRLYQGLWRYTGLIDLAGIVYAVVASSVAFFLLVRFALGITDYPRSVYLLDAILLIWFMAGVRLLRRVYREFHRIENPKRVLIFGAGDAGEMIVRDMKHNRAYQHEPIGFVDDDRAKVGQRIHGVPVLGTRDDIVSIVSREEPDEVLIAMPTADLPSIRGIVRALEPFKVPIKTLPSLRDIIDGRVRVGQIRDLSIEDLLPRAPIGLNPAPLDMLIEGRSVLVTGGGGSIGSELCRQVAALRPKTLVLLDRYENTLFSVSNELQERFRDVHIEALIGDIADANRVGAIMSAHRPDVVFHAAAHKHVPLMEASPCEAVKNNVAGTWVLSHAAKQAGVQHFVMISTDKAVNPTSVMGVTKRVCELIVQAMAASANGTGTRFAVVRFGNVLGSNGSVVPRFLQQIRAGGPVTVTHPEIKRYFMLIPEAVQLVLHAATLAKGGEVFVLDMGEQIKIADLARNLIRLSGFVPDRDIKIEFTGLRPGEKLYEELVGVNEDADRLAIDKIFRVRRQAPPDMNEMQLAVQRLYHAAVGGDVNVVLAMLTELVPTFQPEHRPAFAATPAQPRQNPVPQSVLTAWPLPSPIQPN